MIKGELLGESNEKLVYATDDPGKVILRFQDVASAYNNVKTALFPRKGIVDNRISAFLMDCLQRGGLRTHFISLLGDREQLCRTCTLIPLEVVSRNLIAGSLADRLALDEGTRPSAPIYDIYFKDTALGDPMINDTQAIALDIVSHEELSAIYGIARKANEILSSVFSRAGITLVDFKLEFGKDRQGNVIIVDEITPDTCRLWDAATGKRLDKDRFRHDLGNIVPSYEEVLARLESIDK